jgi:hypothetical protein
VVYHHALANPAQIGTDLGLSPGTAAPQAQGLPIEQPIVGVLHEILPILTTQPRPVSADRPIDTPGQSILEAPYELSPWIRLE